jgi:hypothetical protein
LVSDSTEEAVGAGTDTAATAATGAAGAFLLFLSAGAETGAGAGAAGATLGTETAAGTSSDFFWTRLGAVVGLLIVLDPVVIFDMIKRVMTHFYANTRINFINCEKSLSHTFLIFYRNVKIFTFFLLKSLKILLN